MSTGEPAVDKPCADITVLRFKIDALQDTVEHIKLKYREVSEAAMRAVSAAMSTIGMGSRDSDPDRETVDYVRGEEPRIRRERPVPPRRDYALWISAISLLITAGGIVFWTGRFTAQSEAVQRVQTEQASEIRESSVANARQDVTLGIIGQQYAEITRRLNSIEQKVDTRP